MLRPSRPPAAAGRAQRATSALDMPLRPLGSRAPHPSARRAPRRAAPRRPAAAPRGAPAPAAAAPAAPAPPALPEGFDLGVAVAMAAAAFEAYLVPSGGAFSEVSVVSDTHTTYTCRCGPAARAGAR
jgi:hypothetical protein